MTDRTVTVRLQANVDQYNRSVGRAADQTRMLERNVGRAQGSMRHLHLASRVAGGIVGGAFGAMVVSSVRAAASFDVTMRQIAVATNRPATAIAGLRQLALKMGQDTVFSAQDAGDAMLELAKGGLSEAQIRAGALASTLTLASAGGLQLGDAAGYIVQGLSTFNLDASKANDVAAALAGGANASTASVQDMGLALSQVGPGASQAGMTLQETTAVLAAFAQNGIKGSDAGTSLKTMLQRLVPTTDKQAALMKKLNLHFVDAHGHFLSVDKIAQQLHDHLGKLSDAQRTTALNTIFGSDASRAAAILMKEGAKGIQDYTRATSDKTQADKLAKATTDGMAGSLSQLSGSIDTAKLQLGTALAPLISDLADHMTGWANSVTRDVIPALAHFVKGMEDGTGPGGEFVDILSEFADAGKQAWSEVQPFFSFMAAHPHMLTQVAKDAVILAGALKVRGFASALTGLGPGGAVAGVGAGAGGGAPARGVIRTAAGRGVVGAGVGGLIGATTTGATPADWRNSLGTAAAAGLITGGLPGAVVAVIGDAVVMGLRSGSQRAAQDKEIRANFAAAVQGITAVPSPLGKASVTALGQSKAVDPTVRVALSRNDVTTAAGLAKALKEVSAFGSSQDNKRWRDQIIGIAHAYRAVHMDSLQLSAYLQNLANLGMASAREAERTATGLAKAPSDSVDRLTQRFPHLITQSRNATDSLHALERQAAQIPDQVSPATDSLHALERQLNRLSSPHVITISMIEHFKATNPAAANDPELRTIAQSITTQITGTLTSTPATRDNNLMTAAPAPSTTTIGTSGGVHVQSLSVYPRTASSGDVATSTVQALREAAFLSGTG